MLLRIQQSPLREFRSEAQPEDGCNAGVLTDLRRGTPPATLLLLPDVPFAEFRRDAHIA